MEVDQDPPQLMLSQYSVESMAGASRVCDWLVHLVCATWERATSRKKVDENTNGSNQYKPAPLTFTFLSPDTSGSVLPRPSNHPPRPVARTATNVGIKTQSVGQRGGVVEGGGNEISQRRGTNPPATSPRHPIEASARIRTSPPSPPMVALLLFP
jgi:hypothetical protein